jgi:branched-chain amino acid transport system permease protein
VRYLAFMISGFFAGISGGLAALNFEIVTAEVVGAARSGAYLLFVFLGGATFFFGPIIGAVLMVVALVLLSELTKAWLLYLGIVFLFMVMYAPGGIASLLMMNLRLAAFGKLDLDRLPGAGRRCPHGPGGCRGHDRDAVPPAAQPCTRADAAVPRGATIERPQRPDSWSGALLLFAVGVGLFEYTRSACSSEQWGTIQEDIEKEIKRREAL